MSETSHHDEFDPAGGVIRQAVDTVRWAGTVAFTQMSPWDLAPTREEYLQEVHGQRRLRHAIEVRTPQDSATEAVLTETEKAMIASIEHRSGRRHKISVRSSARSN